MPSSLPVQSGSLSYWHRTTRAFPHLNANRQTDVPASTRYLIIGSGLSGTLVAWELLENGVQGEDIVILEAREAVSGATGRNAGHIRPDAFRGFSMFSEIHGPEQARKILEDETVVLNNVRAFVKRHKIDCDFNYTTTLDVALTQEFADYLARAYDGYKAAGGDVSGVRLLQGEEFKAKNRMPGAVCAYEWPAASNHPAKLTQWILSAIINRGVRLWTHCPAKKVVKHQGQTRDGLRWDVDTPRGVISSQTVVHCTNAYAGVLLPELADFITPRRAQAHAFVPPASASGHEALRQTMSLRYQLHHFFSVNQVLGTGTIILGGTATRSDSDADARSAKHLETFDDSRHSEALAENSTEAFSSLCPEPETDGLRHGEGLDHAWTGILGTTPDKVPLVGPVEGMEGQWICAVFNGHGMARIFACAPGLVQLMRGKPWSATGLPECFQYSTERVKRLGEPNMKSRL